MEQKATVADLTKDWEEEENDGSAGEAEETIESIVSFIQDENQAAAAGTEPQPAKEPDAAAAAPAGAETAAAEDGDKKGKSKEEWVTLIFGEDGKEIPAPQEKSVYDLDPDEEDKNGEQRFFN